MHIYEVSALPSPFENFTGVRHHALTVAAVMVGAKFHIRWPRNGHEKLGQDGSNAPFKMTRIYLFGLSALRGGQPVRDGCCTQGSARQGTRNRQRPGQAPAIHRQSHSPSVPQTRGFQVISLLIFFRPKRQQAPILAPAPAAWWRRNQVTLAADGDVRATGGLVPSPVLRRPQHHHIKIVSRFAALHQSSRHLAEGSTLTASSMRIQVCLYYK